MVTGMAEEKRNIETFLEEVCFGPLLEIKSKYEAEERTTDEVVISPQQSKPSLTDLLLLLNSPFYKQKLSRIENYLVSKIENIRINLLPGNSGHAAIQEDTDFIIHEIESAVFKLTDERPDDLDCTNFKQYIEETKRALFPNSTKRKHEQLKEFPEDIPDVKKSAKQSKEIPTLATNRYDLRKNIEKRSSFTETKDSRKSFKRVPLKQLTEHQVRMKTWKFFKEEQESSLFTVD